MQPIGTVDRLLAAWVPVLNELPLGTLSARCILEEESGSRLLLDAPPHRAALEVRCALYPSRELLDWVPESERQSVVILSPHIPDSLAEDLRQHGINHADLNGRIYLRTSWLLLDREPKSRKFRNPVSEPALFSGKSSRLIRLFLRRPARDWNQESLVERTGLSRGLVSRLLKSLIRHGHVSRREVAGARQPGIYRVQDFDRLLNDWKSEDVWRKRVEVVQFSVLAGDLVEVAAKVRQTFAPEDVCFTQWFAAHLRHPYTTPPLVSAYVRKERFIHSFPARQVSSGGNLWLIAPADEEVFFDGQEAHGFRLASDIQIYLDLLQIGQRGPDQAEALRTWEGFAQT